ncbi:PQQ-binding-like beta-propeller repeat protein [Micromonospora sp. NPDC047465]|uniref:WD40 repeat domain-containing protein n=1 Tax=Micromonospora sp. NPDC047465 TaxID=3154813 RepID=UPI003402F9F1
MRWFAKTVAVHETGFPVSAVACSPDGRWFVAAHEGGFTDVVDAGTGRTITRLDRAGTAIAAVNDVAVSGDGRFVAVAGRGAAEVFDAASGDRRGQVRHDKAVNAVVVSRDGRWMATASEDETARVFEVATGAERFRVTHNGPVADVALSLDDRWIATAGDDGTVRVHDASTGAERHRLTLDDAVNVVVWSEDGRWLATGSDDATARVFDMADGREVSRATHAGPVNAVAFSPDGQWVATAGQDGTTQVFQTATGAGLFGYTHGGPAFAVAWSRDGKWVATGADRAVMFDPATGTERCELEQHKPVREVVFSRVGSRVVAAGDGGQVCVYGMETVREVCHIGLHHVGTETELLNLSPDGQWVATGSWSDAAVYETFTGNRCRLPRGTFSPNGRWLTDGTVVVKVDDGSGRCQFTDLGDGVVTYAWSPSSQWVALMTYIRTPGGYEYASISVRSAKDGQVRWGSRAPWYRRLDWSADDRWLAHGLSIHDGRTGDIRSTAEVFSIRASALSPDGERMLVGTDNGAYLFDAATGDRVTTLIEGNPVSHAAWSHDSRLIAIGGLVFDAATGSERYRVESSGPGVFSPDGRWLAVVHREVQVVDAATGAPRLRLGTAPALSMSWSADGRHLAARYTANNQTGRGEATRVFDLDAVQFG